MGILKYQSKKIQQSITRELKIRSGYFFLIWVDIQYASILISNIDHPTVHAGELVSDVVQFPCCKIYSCNLKSEGDDQFLSAKIFYGENH